jgi:predicted nucleotidyltransferase
VEESAVNIGGITASQASNLRGLLLKIPGVEGVGAFGSRTLGTFTKESDLDIALFGQINRTNPATIGAVREAQEYAQSIGIGMGKEGRAALDIHPFTSMREMEQL